MTGQNETRTVGQLPTPDGSESRLPTAVTLVVWLLWLGSLAALGTHVWTGATWELGDVVAVDGLTLVMWLTVTFFAGIVTSYSRRYMAGERNVDRFFARVFAFVLAVGLLVAAEHLALFVGAWLAMGLVMAGLVGHVDGWEQANTAADIARRYFVAGTGLVAAGLATLWWHTGATTASGVAGSVGPDPSGPVFIAAGLLVVAAMVQSALFPFHRWLLSSMTAPTPASALMHAGFVNAGGVLLVRFAPVVTVDASVMLSIVIVGASSALLGKLLKTVQTDVKGELGCSTVGQMGFMILQAGLGFFGAAITHLILHGCYKAYQFLAAGSRVSHESPTESPSEGAVGLVGGAVVLGTALAGGALFALLTGKGTGLDSGLLLTMLVVLTVLHGARTVVRDGSVPAKVRYVGVPLVALPALAIYASVYRAIEGLLVGLPAMGEPAELSLVHGVVGLAFLAAYVGIETGVYRRSERLYVAVLNAARPARGSLLTDTEDYNEY